MNADDILAAFALERPRCRHKFRQGYTPGSRIPGNPWP